MDQKPSVGRIVHYVDSDGACLAALITEPDEGETVSLAIFERSGMAFRFAAHDEEMKRRSSWHWPERA